MECKILKVSTGALENAMIRKGGNVELPSMQHGWKFNFLKRLNELPNSTAYVKKNRILSRAV